jgi:hypothetical protein
VPSDLACVGSDQEVSKLVRWVRGQYKHLVADLLGGRLDKLRNLSMPDMQHDIGRAAYLIGDEGLESSFQLLQRLLLEFL